MKLLGPTAHKRLNEVGALVFFATGLFVLLALVSYQSTDPSFNTVSRIPRAQNLTGFLGSYLSDFCLQTLGLVSFALPMLLVGLAWRWVRSEPIETAWAKVVGAGMFVLSGAVGLSLAPGLRMFSSEIPAGGLIGIILADELVGVMNLAGAALFTVTCLVSSLYLISTFSFDILLGWLEGPWSLVTRMAARVRAIQLPRLKIRFARKEKAAPVVAVEEERQRPRRARAMAAAAGAGGNPVEATPPIVPLVPLENPNLDKRPPWEDEPSTPVAEPVLEEIPIKVLEDLPPPEPARGQFAVPTEAATPVAAKKEPKVRTSFRLPPTSLLNEPPERNAFDSQELKETAAQIKAKFEEFNVLGQVVQINPGPVVTTFEFKPEAGIKYNKITTLTEDLCLGLQAESILVERIPGKATVGIEVPNKKREMIALRQLLESEEFVNNASRLTIGLGKDISGRIKFVTLETMPHLLVAGSTGSGKSVMLNALIMSVLYKSTPDEVRMILVDPKRVEMGMYEGIPHLLTPVITDPRKATNALRNAVLEMERRLKLLADKGARNIDQYNRKMRQLAAQPRSLFSEEEGGEEEDLRPLPYILIVIDELADLMMLERANVEESVARLAQMARAVGMHLVLATQRPSVDVITGLIKANFPARMSFRVATRVDSRTILDSMGAEHLLGKGDMLFLPPGSSRQIRVHGAFVTESEVTSVVDFWKDQARPEYDQSFLIAPPSDDDEEGEPDAELDGEQDPMYADAVRVVCEVGKASTSTLQRRLRLGYGRAARILDMMQREGIIGPPDGSRPRDVLRRPDWLDRPPSDDEL